MIEHGAISCTDLNTFKIEEAKAFCAAALGMEFQGFDIPRCTCWVAPHGGDQARAHRTWPVARRAEQPHTRRSTACLAAPRSALMAR
jgi:hypothetical protein